MAKSTEGRLISLDALKGLTMLLIIGLDGVLRSAGAMAEGTSWGRALQQEMGHVPWEGLHVYDLIFPLFVFISGMAMNFSLRRRMSESQSILRISLHVWIRAGILVLLGFMVNGTLSWDSSMRYASVLGLIGISGALCSTLAITLRSNRALTITTIIILVSVWLAQHFGGDYTPGNSVNAKIDALLCPGKLYYGSYDPEGPLCIVSATALALIGYLSARLFSSSFSTLKRVLIWGIGGATLIFLSSFGIIIKNIWSPAFVLVTAGWGCVLMAIFHPCCDIISRNAWCYPLRVVGYNALFIYVFTHVTDFNKMITRLFSGVLSNFNGASYALAWNIAYLLVAWLLCLYLYKRNICFRI